MLLINWKNQRAQNFLGLSRPSEPVRRLRFQRWHLGPRTCWFGPCATTPTAPGSAGGGGGSRSGCGSASLVAGFQGRAGARSIRSLSHGSFRRKSVRTGKITHPSLAAFVSSVRISGRMHSGSDYAARHIGPRLVDSGCVQSVRMVGPCQEGGRAFKKLSIEDSRRSLFES